MVTRIFVIRIPLEYGKKNKQIWSFWEKKNGMQNEERDDVFWGKGKCVGDAVLDLPSFLVVRARSFKRY